MNPQPQKYDFGGTTGTNPLVSNMWPSTAPYMQSNVTITPPKTVNTTFPLSKDNTVEIRLTQELTIAERDLLIKLIDLLPLKVE